MRISCFYLQLQQQLFMGSHDMTAAHQSCGAGVGVLAIKLGHFLAFEKPTLKEFVHFESKFSLMKIFHSHYRQMLLVGDH